MSFVMEKSLSRVLAVALAISVVALAGLASLSSAGTVKAAVPTTVTILTNQAVGATTVNNGVASVGIVVDVDDTDALTASQLTDETIVTISTTIGFFVENGLQSVTIACAIDGLNNAASTALLPTTHAVTEGPAGSVEPDANVDADGDQLDAATAVPDGGDEGCLAVDTFLASNTVGTAAISAIATNGGKQGAGTATFAAATGDPATLSLASDSDYIARNQTGYTSPDEEAIVTATVRDTNANSLNATSSVQFDITNNYGGLSPQTALLGGVSCTGVTAKTAVDTNDDDDGGGAAEIATVVCGETAAGGKVELKGTVVGSSVTATRTINSSLQPASITLDVTPFPSAVQGAVATTAKATVMDKDGNMAPNGTLVTFQASGQDTAGPAGPIGTVAGVSTGIIVTNTSTNSSIAVAASAPTANGGIVSDGKVVNVAQGGTGGTATPTGTATGTATPGAGGITSGEKPPLSGGGFGLFVFGGGTTDQLVTASGCPKATSSFYVTSGGGFLTFVPGTAITAVNADFLAKFTGGIIPAGQPFLGKCA